MHVVDAATEGGVVDQYESDLMQRVLHFSEAHVKTVMTHRMDVFSLPDTLTVEEALKLIITSRYSRIPIYHGTTEEIVGIVLLKDILTAEIQKKLDDPIMSVAREPLFVPEYKHVNEMFFQFKKDQLQVAVVLDEYGGFSGIVTREDIVEQLFGKLYDEHEPREGERIEPVVGLNEAYLIHGDSSYLQFCDEMNIRKVPDDKDGTVAAYLLTLKGDIPEEGEVIVDKYGVWTINRMDANSIEEVLFIKTPKEDR
jgi:CBS domain containing-hemolysin-like protein